MTPQETPRPVFGQPGWRRRIQNQYGWDKEFKAVAVILLVLLLSLAFAHAGDDTGLPGDDPKEVGPTNSEVSTTSCVNEMFLPIPQWSRFTKMPPLPDALKPMGQSAAVAAKPAPAAVAETKPDGAPPPKLAPKPRPSKPDPDLVAISPFLQWVKEHPDAAAQARKQAAVDAPAAPALPSGPGGDPYWMPPMLDNSGSDDFQGGSATYSRPQR